MEIFRNLNDHGMFFLYNKLIELKNHIEDLKKKGSIYNPLSIYNLYNEMYSALIESRG